MTPTTIPTMFHILALCERRRAPSWSPFNQAESTYIIEWEERGSRSHGIRLICHNPLLYIYNNRYIIIARKSGKQILPDYQFISVTLSAKGSDQSHWSTEKSPSQSHHVLPVDKLKVCGLLYTTHMYGHHEERGKDGREMVTWNDSAQNMRCIINFIIPADQLWGR